MATAQRRLDLSVTVGALRYLDCTAVGFGQCVVFEGCIAVGAGGVDGHIALGAGVGSHLILRLLIPRLGRGRDKCSTTSQPNGFVLRVAAAPGQVGPRLYGILSYRSFTIVAQSAPS